MNIQTDEYMHKLMNMHCMVCSQESLVDEMINMLVYSAPGVLLVHIYLKKLLRCYK